MPRFHGEGTCSISLKELLLGDRTNSNSSSSSRTIADSVLATEETSSNRSGEEEIESLLLWLRGELTGASMSTTSIGPLVEFLMLTKVLYSLGKCCKRISLGINRVKSLNLTTQPLLLSLISSGTIPDAFSASTCFETVEFHAEEANGEGEVAKVNDRTEGMDIRRPL